MELPNKYTTQLTVQPSQCDHKCRLGFYETFRLFMDLANTHANILGVGQGKLMSEGLFWLTVKTRVRFTRRPNMDSKIKAETWPVKPGSLRTDRCYRISDEDGVLAEGRTEWAIMDMNAGRLANASKVFPEELVFSEDCTEFTDFPRITACDDTYTSKGSFKVTSSDIDMGLHMNNAAYVRTLIGAFSIKELDAMDIKEITVVFKTSAHEGDVLEVKAKQENDTITTGLYFPDGKPAILAQIKVATAG